MSAIEALYFNCFESLVDAREVIHCCKPSLWNTFNHETVTAQRVVSQLVGVLEEMARIDGLEIQATWWYDRTRRLDWLYDSGSD